MKKRAITIFIVTLVSLLYSININAQSFATFRVTSNPENISLDFLNDLPTKQLDFIRITNERTTITIVNKNVSIELFSVDELEAQNIAVDRNRSIKGSLWTFDPDYKSIKRIYSLDDGQLIDKTNYKL